MTEAEETDEQVLPDAVSTAYDAFTIEEGRTDLIRYTISPDNVTSQNRTVTWTSSDTSVLTVTEGQITAVRPGTAVVTMTTVNGKTASCTVTVSPKKVSITLPPTVYTYAGDTIDFADLVTINPSDITADRITWYVRDKKNGTFSGSEFKALAEGGTYVTASYGSSRTSCMVIINSSELKIPDSVTDISLDPSVISAETGHIQKLNLKITPSTIDKEDLKIYWSSSDNSIVYVTNDGEIFLKKEGTVTITASLANGKKATCSVTSKKSEKDYLAEVYAYLSENKDGVYIGTGETYKLEYQLSDPSVDKSKINVRWRVSSNSDCIKIADDGTITGLSGGTALVTLDTLSTTPQHHSYVRVYVVMTEQEIEEKRLESITEVLRLCNIEREKAGSPPLEMMSDLNFLAQIRTDEQTETGEISHTRPNVTPWTTVFQNASIKKRMWGENLIQGYPNPEYAVQGWMESEGHRTNILNPRFTHIGMGVSFKNYECTNANIVTQLFIRSAG